MKHIKKPRVKRLRVARVVGPIAAALAVVASVGAAVAADKKAQSWSEYLLDGGPLTWNGFTLYGQLQGGVAYTSHGAKFNGNAVSSMPYIISRYSNKGRWGFAANDYGFTYLGLKGNWDIGHGVSLLFDAQSSFDLISGRLSDGPRSLVNNNGVPQALQSSNSDSSRAGQIFNAHVYGGLSSKTYGTLTFGRQTTLAGENLGKYDAARATAGFSPLGYLGAIGAIGATEAGRWDYSVKYRVDLGPTRFAAMVQAPQHGSGRANYQIGGGLTFGNFAIDGYYGEYANAIQASALSAAQLLTRPRDSLAGVVTDTSGFQIAANYTIGKFIIFGGFEQIQYNNPKKPLTAPFDTIGGYTISVVNNAAFPHTRILNVSWTGLRYKATDKLDLNAGYYYLHQNSYGARFCKDVSAATCAGHEHAWSLLADYRYSKRVSMYAGVFYSKVANGMASGFLHKSNIAPQAGLRYTF